MNGPARRRISCLLAALAVALGTAAALHHDLLAAAASLIPWTDLTDADALTSATVKTAVVDGRTIHYPTPTRELAAELERRAAAGTDGNARAALRHLAEARRELGDMPGAEAALSQWAASGGTEAATAWAEAARWGARYRRFSFAASSAGRALEAGGPEPLRRAIATERIDWARSAPESGDPIALIAERARLFPGDPDFAEAWIRALEEAGKLKEAEDALRGAKDLGEEQRLLVLSDLKAAHGDDVGALAVLEAFVGDQAKEPGAAALEAFARRTDRAAPTRMEALRAELEPRFVPRSALLLCRYFRGKGRVDLVFQLLAQLEGRHEQGWKRPERRLVSGLWQSVDAVPEAFRNRLAAAAFGTRPEQADDLAALARLALLAGARPLAWGIYDDETYRWAARVDVTPGFHTGALSFLLTGWNGAGALAELEAQRLPERTFETARLLALELEKRSPRHPELPAVWARVMQRHVDRGEGAEALKLLPRVNAGDGRVKAEGRRIALLAMRQTKAPLPDEVVLWKERLALLAPDGSVPPGESDEGGDSVGEGGDGEGGHRRSLRSRDEGERYRAVLDEALARIDDRDRTHRTSLALLLGEMDRLPSAEWLWVLSVEKLGGWNLTESLEPRYRKALATFGGEEWWKRLGRWYARYRKQAELKALGEEIVATFRGSAIFARDPGVVETVPVDAQPNPYVRFADFLALRALGRFPSNPSVLSAAEARLLSRSDYDQLLAKKPADVKGRAVADAALLETRRNAVLFADGARRARFLDALARERRLETLLLSLEKVSPRTPVEDVLLLEGWTRLSQFERAVAFADRLTEAYPGEASRAQDAIALHRSLSTLGAAAEAARAEAIAARTAPALDDARALWTAVGETWEDIERPKPAADAFRRVLAESPREAERVLEVSSAFWDYGHPADGLAVFEEGRKRLGRPTMYAFEVAVLKEELKDRDGALTEYLAALHGESSRDGASPGSDFRAQRRVAQLLGRPAVLDVLLARVARLTPGVARDEQGFLTYLPVLALSPEETSEWDDWMEMSNDPVGREQQAARRAAAAPGQEQGLVRFGRAVQAKAFELIGKATAPAFLETLRNHQTGLADERWSGDRAAAVSLEAAILAAEARLAPSPEARVQKDIQRASFLLEKRRIEEARLVWQELRPRVDALPDGATRIRATVSHARFVEASGTDAGPEWKALGEKYPWSAGVLDDRLDFLRRKGRTGEALDALEAATAIAAEGHREPLGQRLVRDSLAANDTARARRALDRLLGLPLAPELRLSATALRARVAFRLEPSFDPIAFVKAEAGKLPEPLRPDLWAAVAGAARDEGKLDKGVDLFIEALNRRTDRAWLADTCRLAVRAGRSADLLRFFETQKQRSPRDVRWAVAVREIKTAAGDLEGAVAAARDATLVAPEREDLTRETVVLYERLGRFKEAADFLETWGRSRKGDESVAGWRASLTVRGGDTARALQIERASIKDAQDRDEVPENDLPEPRTARAAQRFLRLNRAQTAWSMAVPEGNVGAAKGLPLSPAEWAEMALRAGKLAALLSVRQGDADFLSEAAGTLSRLALPEQREELEADLLRRIFKADGTRDGKALERFWGFAEDAGLDRFREAVARRLLAAPGTAQKAAPWGPEPEAAFVKLVADNGVVERRSDGASKLVFTRRDFTRDWAQYLAAREDDARLEPVLRPLVAELTARVSSPQPLQKELPFAAWFPLDAFVRMAGKPEGAALRADVDTWFRTHGAHQRFLAATGSRWSAKLLLPLASDDTRRTFLVRGAPPPPASVKESPVWLARVTAEQRVGSALEALVFGQKDAVTSPDVVRLRGPRTVGDVLGSDPRWTFPELAPSPGDTGDDALTGTGVDKGRVPGRLWGHRPGTAWFVLEALAAYREKRKDAPSVLIEAGTRGDETTRTLLAGRTAEALGDRALAAELDERYFADLSRADRLLRRLRLASSLGPAGQGKAAAILTSEVKRQQKKASAETWRLFERAAEDLNLPGPASALDRTVPVSGSLLAILYDRLGPAAASAFRTDDRAELRSTLYRLWGSSLDSLPADKAEVYVREVWANGFGASPEAALRRLGGLWPAAAPYLGRVPYEKRATALEAVRALPDASALEALSGQVPGRDTDLQLLLLRADLSASRDDAAVGRLQKLLEDPGAAWADLSSRPPETGEGESEEAVPAPTASAPSASALAAALRAFREAKRPQTLERAETLLHKWARDRIDEANQSPEVWGLALDLVTGPAEKADLFAELERTWARGEWTSREAHAALVRVLVRHDRATAQRWLARLPEPSGFGEAETRARLLVALKDTEGAKATWVAARERLPLTRGQEMRAFDAWRQAGGEPGKGAPATWVRSRAFWASKGSELATWGKELASHLLAHPYDRLAARVVLRSLAPAPETVVAPASLAVGGSDAVPSFRVARAELTRSAMAARNALRTSWINAAELGKRRFPAPEIDALLADAARIGVRAGDEGLAERSLSALEDRRSPSAAPLRLELARLRAAAAPRPDRVADVRGRLQALHPRDLTWDLYARILNAEDVP